MISSDRQTWTLPWRERPREEAALFNPAFCVELLSRTTVDYGRARSAPMPLARATPLPLALAFLVVPLVLHPGLRDVLPRRSDTAFGSWALIHQHILVHVPARVVALRPVVREALMFGFAAGALALENGGLAIGDRPMRLGARPRATTEDADEIRRAAALLGRWFAAQSGTASVLQGFGVRP